MKTLSDYKGEEAIELWADLIEPLTVILGDRDFTSSLKGKAPLIIAKEILVKYKKEASEILLRIDPEPLDGMNILTRLLALLIDINNNAEVSVFFGLAESAKSESEFSGSVTENTEDGKE